MMPEFIVTPQARMVFEVVLKLVVMLGIAFLFSLLFNRAPASYKSRLWKTAIIISLALTVMIPVVPSVWGSPVFQYEAAGASGTEPASAKEEPVENQSVMEVEPAGYLPDDVTLKGTGPGWEMLIIAAWFAGFAVYVLVIGAGKYYIHRIRGRSVEYTDERLFEIMENLPGRELIGNVLISDRVTVAFTTGWIKPSIVLPASARNWSDRQLKSVLMHELAHIENRDSVFELLAHLLVAIHWFNPLVWLATRQYRIERERACDDKVLSSGIKAPEYAKHLMKVAQELSVLEQPVWVKAAKSQGGSLKDRIIWILAPDINRSSVYTMKQLVIVVILFVLFVPVLTFQVWAESPAQHSAIETTTPPADPDAAISGDELKTVLKAETDDRIRYSPEMADEYRVILRGLGDRNFGVRVKAAMAFAALENPFDVPGYEAAAVTALKDDWYLVRCYTWKTLANHPDIMRFPEFRAQLIAGMTDEHYLVRADVFELIVALKLYERLPEIYGYSVSALDDYWYIVRLHAIEILAAVADAERVDGIRTLLTNMVQDKHPLVRAEALETLNRLR